MKKQLLLMMFFIAIGTHSQVHISSIKIGYDLNNGFDINGWEEAKWKEETNLKYKAKSFLINHKTKRKGNDIQEYLQYGGKDFTVLTFFYENSGKVIAIKESSGIHKPGIYGVNWYNSRINNKKDLSSKLSNVIEMDNYRSKETLKRYYSVFIKGDDISQDVMQVFTIDDKLITKEYYFAKSDYQSVSWVSNPYQKVKKLRDLFDEKELYDSCIKIMSRESNKKEICSCVLKGMKKSITKETNDLEYSNLFSSYTTKCYKNPNLVKNNKLIEDSVQKSNNFYKTIVNLNLRSEPNTKSKVLVMIPMGETVLSENVFTDFNNTFKINEKNVTDKWGIVHYGKKVGWLFFGGLVKK